MCLVGDNSLCICLCIIVVLWPQPLHEAGVLCLMRPVAGRFCAAVMQRLPPNLCLLLTQMWAGGVICNMTEICFVWREDSTLPCLLKTNSSIGWLLFPEQTDLYTIRTFGLHDPFINTLPIWSHEREVYPSFIIYYYIYFYESIYSTTAHHWKLHIYCILQPFDSGKKPLNSTLCNF